MRTVYATTLPGWFDSKAIAKGKWNQQLISPSSARAGRMALPPTHLNKFHDTKLIVLQKILLQVQDLAPYTTPTTPLIVGSQVVLGSTDGTFHRLRLATDEGVVRVDVEQPSYPNPGILYLSYLPMQGGDGFTYRVSFMLDEGVTHIYVDPTQRVDAGLASVSLMNITDGLTYVCTLTIDEGVPHFTPAQTP